MLNSSDTTRKPDSKRRTLFGQGFSEFSQTGQAVGTELIENGWQHLCELLCLGMACDGEGVGCQRSLDFGVVEVDHCSLVCKHVDLQHQSIE